MRLRHSLPIVFGLCFLTYSVVYFQTENHLSALICTLSKLFAGLIWAFALRLLYSSKAMRGQGPLRISFDTKVWGGALLVCGITQALLGFGAFGARSNAIGAVALILAPVAPIPLSIWVRLRRQWRYATSQLTGVRISMAIVLGIMLAALCYVLIVSWAPEACVVRAILVLMVLFLLGWSLGILSGTKGEFDAQCSDGT